MEEDDNSAVSTHGEDIFVEEDLGLYWVSLNWLVYPDCIEQTSNNQHHHISSDWRDEEVTLNSLFTQISWCFCRSCRFCRSFCGSCLLDLPHSEVTYGGCQRLQRKPATPWCWVTEVQRSFGSLVTLVSICCWWQRPGRGLTAEKGTRPSTSLFMAAFRGRNRNGNFWRLYVSAEAPSVFLSVVLYIQLCVCMLFMHNIWGCGWNDGKWSVLVAQLPPTHPPTASNLLLLLDTKDIFSFSGWSQMLTTQLDYFESSSQGCGTGRECKKFHLQPQIHLPLLHGVRPFLQSTMKTTMFWSRLGSKCPYSGFFFS